MLSYLSDLLPVFLKLFPIFSLGSTFVGISQPIVLSSRLSSALCLWLSGSNRTMTHSPMVLSKPSLPAFCMDTDSTHPVPLSLLSSTYPLNPPLLPLQEEEEMGSHRLPGHFPLTLPFFLFFLSFYFFSFSLVSLSLSCTIVTIIR